ncbi:restriction endonuclease subunit S [Serratia marcescens]|uniref:restriction endonuclease subunit S n=1 Tax=Serratia marcescens TaxID=615 RepID=UPI0030CD5534
MSGGKLPEGWINTTIGDISVKCSQRVPDENEPFIYVDIGSINRELKVIENPQYLIGRDAPSRARKEIKAHDIIVSLTRPNLNAVALVSEKYDEQIASTGFEVIRPTLVESRYIFALVRSRHFIDSISGLVQGALYPAAKSSDVQSYEFPLPPLAEQKIIAEKLDTLLAQVDSTKARLEQIPQILKRFRQSILASAVNGNLTEEWRKKNSLNIDNWEKLTLGHIVKNIEAGKNLKCIETPPNNGQYGIIKISAVTWGEYDEDESKTLPDDSLFVESRRIATGDFLISRANTLELLGNPVIVKKVTKNLMLSDKVLRLVMADDDKPWVNIFLRSCYGRREIEFRSTGNQLSMRNIGQKALLEIPMPKPPAEEQHEIVRRVEQLFAYADTIEKQVNYALIRVKNLPQSILAKAFRGELSSQWRAEHPELITGKNSATALLKKIKDEREAIKILPKPKRSTIKKKTGERMSKQIIKVVEALTQAGEPLSGQQLLAAAGYPSDSSTDDLEKFFLDVRQSLIVEKSIVKLERKNDGQDWFSLAEMGSNE